MKRNRDRNGGKRIKREETTDVTPNGEAARDIALGDYLSECRNSVKESLCYKIKFDKRKVLADTGKRIGAGFGEMVSDIPIVKFLEDTMKFGKTVFLDLPYAFTQWRFGTFFEEYCDGSISDEYLEKLRKRLNGKWSDELISFIINTINETVEEIKLRWLARVVKAYVNETITNSELFDYMDIVRKIFLTDIQFVEENWKTLSETGCIVVDELHYRNLYRLACNGIGEHGTPYSDKDRMALDKAKKACFYYGDNYSRKFFNILCDSPKLQLDVTVEYRDDRTGSPYYFVEVGDDA